MDSISTSAYGWHVSTSRDIGFIMANGPRSIYSRRQRMAHGQNDHPLADFLDNLPGYVNQFQQNQLALGKQQLAENRYQEERDYRQRQEERAVDQQNINNLFRKQTQLEGVAREKARQLEKLEDRKREDDNAIRRTGDTFVSRGQYDQALKIYESIGDVSAIDAVRSLSTQKNDLEDRFVAVRSKIGNKEISPIEIKDELNSINKDFDIDPLSQIGKQLYGIEQLNNKEINRLNKGFIPPSEWESRFGASGRMDYNNLVNAEKNLQDLAKEQASPSAAITSGIGGATLKERIEIEEKTIQEILNQPKYKLETEAEYRARKELEKQASAILGKADMARNQGLVFPSIGPGETTFDIATPTEENFAQVNDAVSKDLDKVLSDPNTPTNEAGSSEEDYPVATEAVPGLSTEEKRELGMPMLNLPTVEAGQDSPQAPTKTDTTLKLGKEISANVKKPKGRYGSVEGALAETYKKMEKIKKLEDKSSYNLKTKGGQQSYKNSLKQADKLRNQLKEDILSIYDPNTEQFRYPGYAEMFSPVGDTVMSFGREKQLDTRNIAGGFTGRQRIPVTDIMPFIQELFPPQFASR